MNSENFDETDGLNEIMDKTEYEEDDIDACYDNIDEIKPTDNMEEIPHKPFPRLSKYERARILGARANQINDGAEPQVDIGSEHDAINIAILELEQNKLPLSIIRTYPNGNYQIYNVYRT